MLSKYKYILKSFFHYLKANLLVAAGVAISTTVLTGSLIIGDSVRYSLEQTTFFRLGETTHLATAKERYFRQELAREISFDNPSIKATPMLLLEGVAVARGGQQRANRVQVAGVENTFDFIAKDTIYAGLNANEIYISRNLSERLNVAEGDNILVRIRKASLIPLNAPFVSAEETSVSMRAIIKKILTKEELGRFSLKNSQTAPYNIFLSIQRLNDIMELEGKANNLLIYSDLGNNEIRNSVNNCLTPADAGLEVNYIEATEEVEISTHRIFMDQKVSEILFQLPESKPLITYFVNGIGIIREDHVLNRLSDKRIHAVSDPEAEENYKEVPYSFVSSLNMNYLNDGEIILTQWAADDLNAIPGDSVRLKYFEIGPLRKLAEKESWFILKDIVPMNEKWADSTLMPWLPGLSDAGHCREWDAGVPINMDAIRDTDEDYWNEWKGAPKAYISLNEAHKLWKNRFGVYTAFRYPVKSFDKKAFNNAFDRNITHEDIGMAVEPLREQGLQAARNGTDFSMLFLGLSFFILAASVILTALLFRLNLETRSSEIGILTALGFRNRQIGWIFILEGFVIALSGAFLGLILSILYTYGVFKILNTLWFEIVRTNVLLLKVNPSTLCIGLIASITVSIVSISVPIYLYRKRQAADLQKKSAVKLSRSWRIIIDTAMWLSLGIPAYLLLMQLLSTDSYDTSLFFLSGGLLLIGFLLAFRKLLVRLNYHKREKISLFSLSYTNLGRNMGRSLTVFILFSLGTFLVVSTGSNKLDLFANALKKSSGTGGFLFFAETTMPVLYDLNNPEKRSEEGIYENFSVVHFRKIEGDDASCLNLNRIKQPAILGVDPEKLSGRFSFATRMKGLKEEDSWKILEQSFDDGSIPAIADQTVIQWGLGKKTGDELLYQNENGDTLRLKLIAGTKPSVFQGNVIISNRHFLENYPTSSGSYVFLIDGDASKKEEIRDELQSVFRDYGWQMEAAARRLAEFYSVTNTYLSIFLALGALGMILGTVGLTVILARTILERHREMALMQAIGFTFYQLFHLLVNEYLFLLFAGVLTGFVTAVVATLPSFLSVNSDASLGLVAIVTGLILFNGIIWITGLSWFSLRKKQLADYLRVE